LGEISTKWGWPAPSSGMWPSTTPVRCGTRQARSRTPSRYRRRSNPTTGTSTCLPILPKQSCKSSGRPTSRGLVSAGMATMELAHPSIASGTILCQGALSPSRDRASNWREKDSAFPGAGRSPPRLERSTFTSISPFLRMPIFPTSNWSGWCIERAGGKSTLSVMCLVLKGLRRRRGGH